MLHPTTKPGSAQYTISTRLISLFSTSNTPASGTWIWPCFGRLLCLFYYPLSIQRASIRWPEQNELRSNAFPNPPFLHKHITNTTTTLTTDNNITLKHHYHATEQVFFLFHDDGRCWKRIMRCRRRMSTDILRAWTGTWPDITGFSFFFFFLLLFLVYISPMEWNYH